MERLRNKYLRLLNTVNFDYKRYLYDQINWDDRLIIIKGQRGVGKTTLLLQYIKSEIQDIEKSLYIALDDIYFTSNKLSDLVEDFVQNDGRLLLVDEVHSYPGWSVEIKNIYDFYPNLKVVITGSSAIAIQEGEADLSRRATVYHLQTLSLREYIALSRGIHLEPIDFADLIQNHEQIAIAINQAVKPIQLFNEFLKFGSYPFVNTEDQLVYDKLKAITNLIIDNDITAVENITYETRIKIKKLLYLISTAVPFKPNITKLSQKVGTSRDVLLKHLHLLSRAGIINLLTQSGIGTSIMQKPEKIYINNATLMYALDERANKGTLRETFFMSQVATNNKLNYPKSGDFIVNDKYVFEIGGKNKTHKQIAGNKNAFIASDDIEYGLNTKIPLWLFGFLY